MTNLTPDSTLTEPIRFTEQNQAEVRRFIAQYPEERQKSAILPVLHLAQAQWGWLPVPVMDYVAELLSIEPIEVYEVATFYTMFHLNPVGKYVLEVCRTGPCMLMGAENIVEHLENKLGIRVGETTADGLFTIKTVECLAACGAAPVLQVNKRNTEETYKYYEHLTPQKLDDLVQNEWI